MPIPEELAIYCSSLVVITSRRGEFGVRKVELQLAHFSVQEYLRSCRIEMSKKQYFDQRASAEAILEICVSYLMTIPYPTHQRFIERSFPFAQFSAAYWPHFEAVIESSSNEVADSVKKIYCSRDALELSYYLHNPETGRHLDIPLQPSPLSWAVFYELKSSVRLLLAAGADVNEVGLNRHSALDIARRNKNMDMLRLLTATGQTITLESGVGDIDLNASIVDGDICALRSWLGRGANIKVEGGDHGSPLNTACFYGHEEIVLEMLNHGVDVNVPNKSFGSALGTAASKGYTRIIRLLLDRGARAYTEPMSAFAIAVSRGQEKSLVTLFDHGATLEKEDHAVQCAAEQGHGAILQLLLAHGGNPNARSRDWEKTPALISAIKTQAGSGIDMVRLLLENGANANARTGENRRTALSCCRYQELVLILLEYGAEVTPGDFIYFCRDGPLDIVKLLIDHGADANLELKSGSRPLMAAASGGDDSIVSTLLHHGANIHACHEGRTALDYAVMNSKIEVARILLERGAEKRLQGGNSGLLVEAVEKSDAEMIQLLINYGADLNFQNEKGISALHMASSLGKAEVAQLLIDNGAEVNLHGGPFGSVLGCAAVPCFQLGSVRILKTPTSNDDHLHILKILTRHGGTPTARSPLGKTVLSIAAWWGNFEAMEFLLAHGVELHEVDLFGRTALFHAAAKDYSTDSVELLMANGAAPDIKDCYGNTPLIMAIRNGDARSVSCLIQSNRVDLHGVDGRGRSAMWWAKRTNVAIYVEMLREFGVDDCELKMEGMEGFDVPVPRPTLQGTPNYECDVCLKHILLEDHGWCSLCCDGSGLRICSTCVDEGFHCFDSSHKLAVCAASECCYKRPRFIL
ncbi:hypothetical protein NLG97_g2546 [Lecanicillium saksenae]|uniref:Uncharacterized protein n=1 Tax=Lecanicillium saksenae TaxID=468837 RepID=A0ACC1R2G0_9HYPO|nr:hypothetical protein NLG97_g2546 [Lecanicillium saksenae]